MAVTKDSIIAHLKEKGAISRETAVRLDTLSNVLEMDSARFQVKMGVREEEIQVSDKSTLRMEPFKRDDFSVRQQVERVQQYAGILVWLGPKVLREMEKENRERRMLAAMEASAKKPVVFIGGHNTGAVVGGDLSGGTVNTGQVITGDHNSPSLRSSANMDLTDHKTSATASKPKTHWLQYVAWAAAVVGAVAASVTAYVHFTK